MRKGTIGAAKIGGSFGLLLVAAVFSIYYVVPALAAHGDSNGPQFFFNATSNTSYQYRPGANYGFQVNITNETGVYGTIGNITFELGRPSGTLTNYTKYSSILVQNYTNLSFINFTQEQLGPAGTYNYTWYANDTAPASGKWNKTQTVAFTVSANQTNPISLWMMNGSSNVLNQNMTRLTYPAITNTTVYLNYIQSGLTNLSYNDLANNTLNNTNATLLPGVYKIIANTSGNANYTSNSTTYYISIAPLLNQPTPANGGYIYGTSAQLFQINITDNTKAAATNATLYYKRNNTGIWQTNATYCYYGTPSYVCNVSVNIGGSYLENDRIQYFFNISDITGNIGTNGTAGDPLFVILDQTSPRSSNVGTNDTDNIIAKGAGINLSVRWTDNYGLFNATLSTNESGSWRNITNAFASPLSLSGISDWSNFSWVNNSVSSGTVVAWKVYVNDQVLPTRNENVSAQGTFTIDGTAPAPSGNATTVANGSTYSTSANYGFQINWTDTVGVSNATFELGRSDGIKSNYTNATTPGVVIMGNTHYINFTQAAFGPAGTYNFSWLANDTSNNWNRNDTIQYVIVKAAAPTVQLLLNSTDGNRTYNKSDVINQSATSSISGLTVTLYNNMNGTLLAIGNNLSTINVTNVTTLLTLGTYSVIANVSSNENYTANITGLNYFITLTDTIAPTMKILNATSGAQLFNNTRVKNSTSLSLNITVSDNDRFTNPFNASVYIGTTFAGNITNVSVNAANGTITIPNGLANGNLTLNVSITDASGNAAYNTTFTVDVDNIAPVIRYLIPAQNNTFIKASSSERFEVNVTEANLDLTKNITVLWRRQGLSAWNTGVTRCYYGTPQYVCNASVDLSTLGTGDKLEYYFNTTDLAGNAGNNGTATTFLVQTVEQTIPQFIGNASSLATYQNYSTSANYGFQINWTNGAAEIQTVTFQLGRPSTGLYTNHTATQNGSSTYIYNASQIALGPAGIYNITWYANDTAGNANTTQTWNYQIYNASNIVNVYLNDSTGEYANMNINTTYGNTTVIRATTTAGTVYIYRNQTQSLVNGTSPQTESALLGAGFIVYKVNATGNQNYSDNTSAIQYNITIAQTGITNYLNLQINGTGAGSVRAYPNVTNVTGWSNVTGQSNLLFALYRNGANVTLNASTAPYDRAETNLLGVGNYTYIFNTTGNSNYTSGSISRSLNITKGTPVLGLHINGTSGNQSYIYTTVTRITANNSDVTNTDGIYELFRNNTNLTGSGNNTNVTLAAGVYLFVHNVTAGTNYTSATTSVYLTISKAATNVTLYLNGTYGNASYNINTTANFTALLNVSGKNLTLYTNISAGWINQSTGSSSRLENLTNLTGAAIYNITAYFAGDENYTSSVQTWYATTVDTVGPSIQVYNSTAQYFQNLTITKSGRTVILNISASDSGVGISAGSVCVVRVGGISAGNISYSSGWCNGTITVPSLSTGYAVLNITINDTENNTGINSTYSLSVDNTAPVLALTAPSNLSYNKKNADGYVWINGTAYDVLGMGVTNVTIGGANASLFAVWSFDGTNNSAFTIRNSTQFVPDGLVNLTLYYNDSMNNTGSIVVQIYEDNTPPSAAIGLTNSTAGTYLPSASQVVQVAVTDAYQANASLMLNYTNFATGSPVWTSVRMTGVPGTTTVYSATIDTRHLLQGSGYVIQYYINGTDNATNWMTSDVGGNSTIGSTLANITINQYCGNNGTAWTNGYCSNDYLYETGWKQVSLPSGSIVNTWSSLSGNRTTSKMLEGTAIAGKYNIVYYYNGSQWLSYDPSVSWSQNDLKYMNNTNNNPYHFNMTAMGGVIKIT